MSGAEVMEISILGEMPHEAQQEAEKDVYSQWWITHLFVSLNLISCDWLLWLGMTGEDDEFTEEQLGEAI